MLSGSKSISLNSDGNYNSNGLKKKKGGGVHVPVCTIFKNEFLMVYSNSVLMTFFCRFPFWIT